MVLFTDLEAEMRLLLSGMLFIAAMCELASCIYRYGYSGKIRRCVPLILIFLIMFVFLTASMIPTGFAFDVPWIIIPVCSAVVILQAAICFFGDVKKKKTSLSANSVKEALDNLNLGVLFADREGRAVLVNHLMNRLVMSVIGTFPQTLADVEKALGTSDDKKITRLEETPPLYRFSDGSVWRFLTVKIGGEGLDGFTRTTAQNVTDIYSASAGLKKENSELAVTNEKLSEMYERLADRIREEETLKLKMRVHNEIGTSLIAISGLMKGGDESDMHTQLAILKNAASYFRGRNDIYYVSFEEAQRTAEKMNITLSLDGDLPNGKPAQSAIAMAACECITNCINHAKGTMVNISVTKNGGRVFAEFTNDGEKPSGEIVEGGGLSSLRKSIENMGGSMTVTSLPSFALTISIPEKEDNQ